MLQIVELQAVPPVPWRNGGGMTQELLAWPSPSDWQCRISVARIDSDGPFSAYPEVERWFAVVQGEGVVLRFADRELRIRAGDQVLRFDGAEAPACELLAGATSDLNFMVRHPTGQGELRVVELEKAWLSAAPLRAVFTMQAAQLQIDEGELVDLAAGTLAFSDEASGQRWRLMSSQPVRAWWLHFAAA